MEGDTLHAEFEEQMPAARVPLHDLKQYLDLQRAMTQETNKQLVLKKS
jgi:hypothetical protein